VARLGISARAGVLVATASRLFAIL